MILKGSQRGSGQDLARHLMRTDENEHVRIHDLRGFASDALAGAFKEAEAISRGTNCRQYLFSLSLSPPADERVSVSVFETALARIEEKLGLEGQPRAVVFHEKEGRRHAHCVWSRIDAATMTAKPLPFFKQKLMGIARELYLEQGWSMPRGLETPGERDPLNFSLAEWQQAKRQGLDPRWLKQAVQQCWKTSDGKRAFMRSLEERALFLAKGDRRGLVVIDHGGEVHALARLLGLKTRDVTQRLGDGADLPGVADTRRSIGARMTPAIRRHIEEARLDFEKRSGALGAQKAAMTRDHRQARLDLDARQSDEWQAETRERAARLPKGLAGLWHRLTGKYQEVRRANEAGAALTRQRHEREREELIEEQRDQRAPLQDRFKALRHEQAQRLVSLRADVGRFIRFSKAIEAATPERGSGLGIGLGE